MNKQSFFIALFCLINFSGQSQNLLTPKKFITKDSLRLIVSRIATNNIVQAKHVGFTGKEGDNFKNFENLKKIATIDQLIVLTYHTNNVVACYATMALADKSYKELDLVFKMFFNNKKTVETQKGCINQTERICYLVYFHYFNKVATRLKSSDNLLYRLDEIILNGDDDYLKEFALKNRKMD